MKIYSKNKILILLIYVFILITEAGSLSAQSKIRSVPISYFPKSDYDVYDQRINQKTIPVGTDNFILLNRQKDSEYALQYYTRDLKKVWETAVALENNEETEAFSRNGQNALLLTYQKAAGNQTIRGRLFDLKTGEKKEPVKLFEAPAGGRRLSAAISENGSHIVLYQYIYQLDQLKSINARIFDGNLNKIKERNYDLQNLQGIASATVRIDNTGNQYVAIVINKSTKLTVRRYNNSTNEIKGMDVQVGGVFDGRQVYILDSKFQLEQDGNLYAATICADEKTGDYYSIKLVRFDFETNDMKYAPEFKFTPPYLAALNKTPGIGQSPVKRLADINLSSLLISPEKNVMLIAEKKYQEGPKLPFVAKEMHYFAYDEYLNPSWNAIIHKNQSAPATEGYAGISYKTNLFGDELQVLTMEGQSGKTALFNRVINIKIGATAPPKPLGLNIITNQGVGYMKDYTVWLDEKNIITVAKLGKKPAFQLSKITLK